MRFRRCAIVHLEPRERLVFDLQVLTGGGTGLRNSVEWIALAPHLDDEVVLSAEEVAALGALSPTDWRELDDLLAMHPLELLDGLRGKGLLVGEDSAGAARDQILHDTHWRSLSATMHYASRWRSVDTQLAEERYNELAEGSLLDHLGPAPPPVRERSTAAQRQSLTRPGQSSALDALLARRVTCRNFDRARALTQAEFSTVLYRVFGARAVDNYAPAVQLLKKGVPSAGGLHPTEAYLLVQAVDGVAPGLYHYHSVDHALEPMRALSAADADELAMRFVAAQRYFGDAHVLVIPAVRFGRNFWKYRNHAKAYRALILDVGHLSQTLYLAATELGLGAFITAAVNEVDIEQAFALDALEEGPLAVCGFGIRAVERKHVEFDPLHAVWPAQDAAKPE
jgi:putative peptide maturation dehydrogenase